MRGGQASQTWQPGGWVRRALLAGGVEKQFNPNDDSCVHILLFSLFKQIRKEMDTHPPGCGEARHSCRVSLPFLFQP